MPFSPGLVGGHCIGVDPYYLTHKAIEVGYKPEMILAGRKLNDNMGFYIVNQILLLIKKKNIEIQNANILIMGLTFKENCPDLRNTRVIDLITEFKNFNCNIDVHDPWANKNEAYTNFGIKIIDFPVKNKYDVVIFAVAHDEFKLFTLEQINEFGKENYVHYDIKHIFKSEEVDGRL